MKRCFFAIILFVTTSLFAQTNILTQYSTIDALLKGIYEGEFSVKDIKEHGNLGIGTFNYLDGEMIICDGNVYQMNYDGNLYLMHDTIKTPFVTVVPFETTTKVELSNEMDFKGLTTELDKKLDSENYFYAFKITGTFKYMQTRSVPKQNKPYIPLAEVVKNQKVFEYKEIEGTIVGFKSPSIVKGLNVPGYHLHFISTKANAGGHILDLKTDKIIVEIDQITNFNLILPENETFSNEVFNQDLSSDLHKVEKK